MLGDMPHTGSSASSRKAAESACVAYRTEVLTLGELVATANFFQAEGTRALRESAAHLGASEAQVTQCELSISCQARDSIIADFSYFDHDGVHRVRINAEKISNVVSAVNGHLVQDKPYLIPYRAFWQRLHDLKAAVTRDRQNAGKGGRY